MYGAARERRQALGNIVGEEEQDPRDMYRFRASNLANRNAQPQAGGAQHQTPPGQQQDSRSSQDRTPSAKAKVLPWVEGIEEGTIPDGMFGPYDSLPPTRMPTMHEQPRQPHPFAFSAPAPGGHGEIDIPPAVPSKDGGSPRKTSPKKAALTGPPRRASPTRSAPFPLSTDNPVPAPRSAKGGRKPVPTMQDSTTRGGVPAISTGGKGHHDHPFSHADAARHQAEAMELARAQALAQLHEAQARGSMDEIPADLARAMGSLGMGPLPTTHGQNGGIGKQGARQTYETGTSGPSFGHLYHDGAHPTSARQSAQNAYGQPIPTAGGIDQDVDIDTQPAGGHPMLRDMPTADEGEATGAAAPGSFVRVPFGVPLNRQLPRPMMVMRTPTGMGMGIGITPLAGVRGLGGMGIMSPAAEQEMFESLNSAEGRAHEHPNVDGYVRDDRSAYVETVEDEDSPTARTHAKSKTHKSTAAPTAAARTDKTAQHSKMPAQSLEKSTAGAQSTMGGLPRGFDPETYPPPAVTHHKHEKAKDKARTAKATTKAAASARASGEGTAPLDVRAKSGKSSLPPSSAAHKSRHAPSERSNRSVLGATLDVLEAQQASRRSLGVVDGRSIASDIRTGDDRSQTSYADSDRTYRPPPSAAPTTASNIKRLVSNSGVHDEMLCQLLDAAKLNLIGAEAKKALQRAARARVIELRDARETQAQIKAALDASEASSARSKEEAKEQSIKAASATTVPPASQSSIISADVPPPQAASVAASRHPAKSQAQTQGSRRDQIIQEVVDARTDISPKTKAKGAPTTSSAQKALTEAQTQTAAVDPYGTPRWAKGLQEQMSVLGHRFDELQRQTDALGQRTAYDGAITPSGGGISPSLLQELMFGGLPGPSGHMSYFALPGMPGMDIQSGHIEAQDSPHSTKIREVPPSTKAREQSGGDATLTWGSEVELPSGIGSPSKVANPYPAPSTTIPRGPIINVHPPTESNARTRAASIPSRTDPRTPAAQTMQLQQDEPDTGMTGMAEVNKSLPDTPETEQAHILYKAPTAQTQTQVDEGRVDTASPPSIEQARYNSASNAQSMQQHGHGYGGYPYEQATTAPSVMPRAYETTVRDGTMQDSATSDTLPTPTGHYPAVLGAPIPPPTTAHTARAPTAAGVPSRAPAATQYTQHQQQQPFTPMTEQQSTMTADAVTAPTHITRPSHFFQPQQSVHIGHTQGAPPSPGQVAAQHTPKSQYTATAARLPAGKARDVIRVREVADERENSSRESLEPWDAVTQKLYQWAMVWEEDSFVKALEGMALGKQVEGLGLTVFMMMVYKRLIAHHLTSSPPQVCDKLFVPPIMADAINQAVHNKQFDSAVAMLEELWYPYGIKNPPRVIVSLAKHRKEADKWTAHRFDMSSGNLTSYAVTSEEQNLPDGRPFMWWYAIRSAWPEYNIPDPELLKQRVQYVMTDPEKSADNSLKAMNYARNLLLGFRPELSRDLGKLRETVWNEVKRLMNKKKSGHLVVDAEHRHHAHL